MITTTTLLLSLLAVPQAVVAPDAVPKADPTEAAKKIRNAIKQGSAPALATIDTFGKIAAREVTAALATGLKFKDEAVQIAAIRALRYNEDKSAFTELYRVRGTKLIMSKAEVAAEYYLALGQHRNKKALPFLVRDLRAKGKRDRVIGPRLLALGRIRDRASVDAIIKFLRSSRGKSREAITSLVVLTGRKESKWISWDRWWKKNRTTFRLPAEEPELDKRRARSWTTTWAVPGTEPPKKKRKGEPESETGTAKNGDADKAKDGEDSKRGKRGRARRKAERRRNK